MASSRKESFIIYEDHGKLLNMLSDEEAGRTIKSIVAYCRDGTIPNGLSGEADIIFSVMRSDIDRNNEKWEETKKQRAEAGHKGGVASGVSRAKQKQANEANASQSKQSEANEAVNVNVNENVNVNVPVNGNVHVHENVNASVEGIEGSGAIAQNPAFPPSIPQSEEKETDSCTQREEMIRILKEAKDRYV